MRQDFIKKNIINLINAGKIAGIFEDSEITPMEWFENNSNAREAAKNVMHYVNPSNINIFIYLLNIFFLFKLKV